MHLVGMVKMLWQHGKKGMEIVTLCRAVVHV